MLLLLLFAIVVDVIMENAREGLKNEVLYVGDLVILSESKEYLREKFSKWKKLFESKWLMVNLNKTKVMLSGSKEEIVKSIVDLCAKCGQRMMANSVLCTNVVNRCMGRCAKMKKVTTLAKGFKCERCVEAIKAIVAPAKELTIYDRAKLVKSFGYLGG